MSRSIHTTRRSVREIETSWYSNKEEKKKALDSARRELFEKRIIKKQVTEERNQTQPPLVGMALEYLPIEFMDESRYVHHAMVEEDLRAVLKELPASATEGIARIQLGLGKEYIKSSNEDESPNQDPYTNRTSVECMPGVWAGRILGSYFPWNGLINIYAYVYDEDQLPIPKIICDLYLRIQALSTFVHEIAHHHDQLCRRDRGRWLAERYGLVESYAERMEFTWVREVVLPYLELTYPEGCHQLIEWVDHHGGIRLPLDFFAGDPRTTMRDGGQSLMFKTSDAFESLVEAVAKGPTLESSRLSFAWELHFADQYDRCLMVLNGILETSPLSLEALVCKADTLVHLERADEAMELVEAVLAIAPDNLDALEVRGDVLEDRKDWKGLLENSQTLLSKTEDGASSRFKVFTYLAIACCGLGEFEQMEEWIQSKATFNGKKRNPDLIRRNVYRRAGRDLN